MKCLHCLKELILGGERDLEEDDNEEYDVVTNLSCPQCNSFVLVYRTREIKDE